MREHQGHSGLYVSKCNDPFGPWQRLATALLRPWFGRRMLLMASQAINVRVFAAPDASCGHGMTWSAASALIGERLRRRFDERVIVEHIEVFSPRSFEFPEVMAAIESGSQLPVVIVGDRIVSQGSKLSDRIIGQAVEALLTAQKRT